jgi:hypothetical protein
MHCFWKIAGALLLLTPISAYAQDHNPVSRPIWKRGAEDSLARVQSNLSISFPVMENEDPTARQQEALRSFYELAAGSCALVIETIADSCEIASVSSNINTRDRNLNGNQITVNGQISMKVQFKAGTGTPAP